MNVAVVSANITGLFDLLHLEALLGHMNSTLSTVIINLVLFIRIIISVQHLILRLLIIIIPTHHILILLLHERRVALELRKSVTRELELTVVHRPRLFILLDVRPCKRSAVLVGVSFIDKA